MKENKQSVLKIKEWNFKALIYEIKLSPPSLNRTSEDCSFLMSSLCRWSAIVFLIAVEFKSLNLHLWKLDIYFMDGYAKNKQIILFSPLKVTQREYFELFLTKRYLLPLSFSLHNSSKARSISTRYCVQNAIFENSVLSLFNLQAFWRQR
jgi:hypothetical protein